jgi:outer membrane protein TolC
MLALAGALCAQNDPPLELSLKRAVQLALAPDGNARVQLAEQFRRQARERSKQARSALLPNLWGSISLQNQTRNLAALGVRLEVPIPGIQFPELVGPFNTFDLRASVTQTIFDFSAIRRFQASRVSVDSANAEAEAARDQVAHLVASLYLAALRADAGVHSAQANVTLAEELTTLALDQKEIGTGTGIEITRARVQLSNEQQRLLVAQIDSRQASLQLVKAIGIRLDTSIRLTDELGYLPPEPLAPEEALKRAMATRADLRAQRTREQSAGLSYTAAKWERLPSLTGFGDYGSIGLSVNNALPTRVYGVALRVPVFDGGRVDSRRRESRSQLEQERIRLADLSKQIELEVRLALDSLRSSEEQVKVAGNGLMQAGEELEQARRRYEAGVASSIEVTDAQTRLARARDNHVAALFLFNKAGVDLRQATGTIQGLTAETQSTQR